MKNASFTLNDLRSVMRACAGESESVDLDGDVADVAFVDLGYDSLAVLEVAGRLRNQLGISIPDSAAVELLTPGSFVDFVCRQLQAAGAATTTAKLGS